MSILLLKPDKKRRSRCDDDTMKVEFKEFTEFLESKKKKEKEKEDKKDNKPPMFTFSQALALMFIFWPFILCSWGLLGAWAIRTIHEILQPVLQ